MGARTKMVSLTTTQLNCLFLLLTINPFKNKSCSVTVLVRTCIVLTELQVLRLEILTIGTGSSDLQYLNMQGDTRTPLKYE